MTATAAPSEKVTLGDIEALFSRLDFALLESDGEITPEVEAALELHGNLEKWKLDAYALRIKSLAGQAAATKALAAELSAKAASELAQVDWLKGKLKLYLEGRKVTELPGSIFTFRIQNNSQSALKLLLTEEEILALDPTLAKAPPPPALDTARIKAAILADGTMYDAIAKVETGTHLRIG